MTKCKHWDCGWCYAPDDVKTNALGNGGCIHSECCPYLKSQNQMKLFNINSTVKVRLTKFGKELHKKDWEDFWSSVGRLDENPYRPPTPDADGYVEFQMWDLMEKFGSHCGMCKEQPFDFVILIDDKETDISKVLIEGDTATIMGVKYKRVEEPKPETLYEALDEVYYGTTYVRREEICDVVERWLPDEFEYDDFDAYGRGWNDALRTIKEKLR
jgi:hypothetical protein